MLDYSSVVSCDFCVGCFRPHEFKHGITQIVHLKVLCISIKRHKRETNWIFSLLLTEIKGRNVWLMLEAETFLLNLHIKFLFFSQYFPHSFTNPQSLEQTCSAEEGFPCITPHVHIYTSVRGWYGVVFTAEMPGVCGTAELF